MRKTYARENGELHILWERDAELWDGKTHSRLYVKATVQKPRDTSKMNNVYREIIKFVKKNKLTNTIDIHFENSITFGKYVLGDPEAVIIINLHDYSENYAVYDFAISKVNELFELDLK